MDITPEILEKLRGVSTPTVSNAIEQFNLRPRHEGFMSPAVRCLFPDLGVMVGWALTARFAASQKASGPDPREDCWRRLLELPEPRILVMQDLDQPAGVGAYFGEVQTNIHLRLGCIGVVTNGHVRDLEEVRARSFHCFAGGVCVSHAWVHLVDFGGPVEVGGLVVRTGDLLHGDRHGVLVVPQEIAAQIPQAAAQVEERERRIIELCRSEEFSLAELKRLYTAG